MKEKEKRKLNYKLSRNYELVERRKVVTVGSVS